jgi:hypothetical protein
MSLNHFSGNETVELRTLQGLLASTDHAAYRYDEARKYCAKQNGKLGEYKTFFLKFSHDCLATGQFGPARRAFAFATGSAMPDKMLEDAMQRWGNNLQERLGMDRMNVQTAIANQLLKIKAPAPLADAAPSPAL